MLIYDVSIINWIMFLVQSWCVKSSFPREPLQKWWGTGLERITLTYTLIYINIYIRIHINIYINIYIKIYLHIYINSWCTHTNPWCCCGPPSPPDEAAELSQVLLNKLSRVTQQLNTLRSIWDGQRPAFTEKEEPGLGWGSPILSTSLGDEMPWFIACSILCITLTAPPSMAQTGL